MEALLGTSLGVFFGITVALMGFAAYMTGHALANTWKPIWHAAVYAALLGFGDRFLTFALFEGRLLSLTGYLIDTAVLTIIALVGYRLTQARKMVNQYPWLCERAGLFGWREKRPDR
jgi:hypothetical protein